ncbi:MAG: YciK family oxidoreductase [Aeromonas sp.]
MQDYQAPRDLLAGKVIFITGASDGLGRAAALSYAAHGARLILLGRSQKKLAAVQAQLSAAGYAPATLICQDLAQAEPAVLRAMATQLTAQFGRLDGLLLNAGYLAPLTPFAHISPAEWQTSWQVNVSVNLFLTQALLPLLESTASAHDGASIIFTSSSVGRRGRAYWGSYAVAKFALEGMMQVLADELAGSGVRVNSLNPGATRTPMRAAAYPAEDATQIAAPEARMPLYLYLMGEASRHCHGQALCA